MIPYNLELQCFSPDPSLRPDEQIVEATSPAHPLRLPEQFSFNDSKSSADKALAILAREYIDQHFGKRLTIIKIARQLGTNDYRLKVVFKIYQHFTVFRYLEKVRMEQSREMMLLQGKRIDEIYLLVGYSNVSNFTNAFKRHFGITPGRMAKAARAHRTEIEQKIGTNA